MATNLFATICETSGNQPAQAVAMVRHELIAIDVRHNNKRPGKGPQQVQSRMMGS